MNPISEKPEPMIPAQQYLDLAGVLILALDPQRRITMINRRGCQILGYEEGELLGQDWFQLCLPAEIQTQASLLFDQLLASQTEAVEQVENPIRCRDGSHRLLAWHHNVIRDPSGQIIGTLSSADDITERKRAEEEIRHLSSFPQLNPNPILEIDQDGHILYANAAVEATLARIGLSDANVFLPPDLEGLFRIAGGEGKQVYREVTINDHVFGEAISFPPQYDTARLYITDITERKRAEEALQESEKKYRSLTEHLNVGVYRNMPGMEGRFLEANPAIVQMFGYPSKEEFLQIPLAQLYQNPQRREEFNREVGEDGSVRVRNMELELKKRDGTSFIGSVSAVGVKGENGEVQYYDGIIEDTTEHKRMEDDLRQSEAKYRNFFENALVGIFQSSPEGRMLGANAAYVRMFGFDSPEQILSEITNAGLQLYANPEDRKVFLELVTEHGVMQPNEFEMMRRDGMRFWVSATASAVRDAKGKVLYYEGTCVDIAERKRAEEAQRESETRYRELFDHISSGVAIYRARDNGNDFVFQDYNQAGEKLDGDRLENVIGKSVLETRPGIKEFGLFDVFQGVWETGVPEHFPVAHYQDNKISGWYENYVYKLPSGEIVAVYDNVTERKQAEEALRESEEKYRTLVEKAQEGIAIIQDIAVQYVNPLLAERWGGQAEEMIGLPISRFIPPESLANLVDRVQRQIAGEPLDAQVEAIFFRKDDSRANTELTSGLISYHGRPALLLMVRDITERKQAEKSLRIQGTMLENLAEGVMVADAWNRITYVNPAFERIFGYERGELIGQDLSILNDLPPEESKRLAQEIFHQCRSKVPGEGKSATGARMASLS